jgi:dTDP-4-amino-4,6-dideoxygalactose transaminase
MKLARKHKLKVIEDVSHAHGSMYKGKKVGTFGDISCMSMMAGKSFAIGEAGMMVTNDRDLYERCIAYGHYERTGLPSKYNPVERCIFNPALNKFAGLPLGGFKHRMNQTCSAMGRVQLKSYDRRIKDIQSAMDRFWDLLDGVPGLKAHRPPAQSKSTMGDGIMLEDSTARKNWADYRAKSFVTPFGRKESKCANRAQITRFIYMRFFTTLIYSTWENQP